MDLSSAINVIESVAGFTDTETAVGEAWAVVMAQLEAGPAPVAVSERLPEPNTKVLAHYFNALGNGRTICAIWVPAKSRSEDSGDDDFTEYDEENDTYYWPEGWYEAIENWDDLGWVAVNEGEVAYWQPLPKWPALPLPSGEEAMTIETTTITVPRIRDNDGQPTCRWWDHHCPFLMQSAFGTREHCFWLDGSGKHRPQLERREHGKGTTIPHPCCPVWEVQP